MGTEATAVYVFLVFFYSKASEARTKQCNLDKKCAAFLFRHRFVDFYVVYFSPMAGHRRQKPPGGAPVFAISYNEPLDHRCAEVNSIKIYESSIIWKPRHFISKSHWMAAMIIIMLLPYSDVLLAPNIQKNANYSEN